MLRAQHIKLSANATGWSRMLVWRKYLRASWGRAAPDSIFRNHAVGSQEGDFNDMEMAEWETEFRNVVARVACVGDDGVFRYIVAYL